MSRASPQQARSRIARLASATATASQPVGRAVSGTMIAEVGYDRGRAHRGEMVAADGGGEQQRAVNLPLSLAFDQSDPGRRGADQRAGGDRHDDQNGIPDDPPLDLEGRHAGIVHGGDASADYRAAEPCAARQRARQGDAETDAGKHDGRDQRQKGKRDVVAARYPRRESEHGDEVRRPDAEPARRSRHAKPDFLHVAGRPADMVDEIDRREGGQQADDCCEHDQTQVMLLHDAIIDPEHGAAPTTAEKNSRLQK